MLHFSIEPILDAFWTVAGAVDCRVKKSKYRCPEHHSNYFTSWMTAGYVHSPESDFGHLRRANSDWVMILPVINPRESAVARHPLLIWRYHAMVTFSESRREIALAVERLGEICSLELYAPPPMGPGCSPLGKPDGYRSINCQHTSIFCSSMFIY